MVRHIKIFSHNDLDGFGAPYLLDAVKETMFSNVNFDIENIGAGRIDYVFDRWSRSPEASNYTDVYIMDMTPDTDYTFQELDRCFANHWLIFDHHETAATIRQKHIANSIVPVNSQKTPSATSLTWDWLTTQSKFKSLSEERRHDLAELVELIRAYDTWDWQNDPDMAESNRRAADEFDQLFWFYPLKHSAKFVKKVFATGWTAYRRENELLIQTLSDRRARYLKSHLKDLVIAEIDGQRWGVVYASDYKSEIAHQLLEKKTDIAAVMVLSPNSISLRANGKLDVAKFAEKYFNGGGHADAAGGKLDINLIKIGEHAVIDNLKQEIAGKNPKERSETQFTLADNLDPQITAKMANFLGKLE